MFEEKTVGEIVADDIRTANVFKKYGLDFCCGGGVSVQSACAANGVDLSEVIFDLEALTGKKNMGEDFIHMPLNELVDYIYNTHHTYIYENAPITAEFINKVAHVHGDHHPETVEIAKLFNNLMQELQQHLMKEEQILFPFIKKLVDDGNQVEAFVNGPISVMLEEHDTAGDILKQMNELSNGYEPPTDGCNTYRAAYANLKALEEDIHIHIHLENNILFPEALKLEASLLS